MSAYAQLCSTLEAAASPDTTIRRPADDQLKQWEEEPGFHSLLQDVSVDRNIDPRVRLLSTIYLKNGIDKFWRRARSTGKITTEEKAKIRQKLLSVLDEDNEKIAQQTSVIIAKIARTDYPNEWPSLLHELIEAIRTTYTTNATTLSARHAQVQFRALTTLYLVVKALCSSRLPAGKKMFQQVSPELLQYTGTIFTEQSDRFLAHAEALVNGQVVDLLPAEFNVQIAVISLKILRRVIVYGFATLHASPDALNVYGLLLNYLSKFVQLLNLVSKATYPKIYKCLTSAVMQIGKIYLDFQGRDVYGFVSAPGSTDALKYYWSHLEAGGTVGDKPTTEKFLVQGMILLRRVVKNKDLAEPPRSAATLDATSVSAVDVPSIRRLLQTELLTEAFVRKSCEVLVVRYLKWSDEELSNWENEPEEFVAEVDSDAWTFSVRPCAEKLFMDLMQTNRTLLQPFIMTVLQSISPSSDPNDLAALLMRDAIYCAVGLAASDLYDFVDFDVWFRTSLASEAFDTNPRSKLIRRRVAWLIGQWLPVKGTAAGRREVYPVVLHLLGDADLVVRLTTVVTLKDIIDDFDFEPADFLPYLDATIERFVGLMKDVEEFDSKVKVLNCLAVLVQRLEEAIKPFAARIVSLLPELWQDAEGQDMFRASIVNMMAGLTSSLKEDSMQLHEFVIPVIDYSVNTGNPAHVYLLEDGIELWLAVIRNATACTEPLLSLFPHALGLLEYGSEGLKKTLAVVEGYVILAPALVLQTYAPDIASRLAEMLGSLRPQASNSILRCLDVVLHCCYSQGLLDALLPTVLQTQIFEKLIRSIMEGTELGVILVGYITVLARVALYQPTSFWQVLQSIGAKWGMPTLPASFVSKWCELFDQMGHGKQRKLTALALANLVGTADPAVIARLDCILPILSSVILDLKDLDRDAQLIYTYEALSDAEDELCADAQRRATLTGHDPVQGIDNVALFVGQKLKEFEAAVGSAQFQQILSGIDGLVVRDLMQLLN
ncbi:armadillo-type protein [Gaertneriomyces semiglobifer]|nr:armadillo-type protein [Gaertneriomyces semiglobifer]